MFGGAGLRFLRWADGGSAVWVEAVVHAHGLCLFLFFGLWLREVGSGKVLAQKGGTVT
jgi:hypothetical protein